MSATPLRPDNRLFVALDLPPAERRALAERGARLASELGGRPVPEANLHLTLAFLGRVPPDRGPDLLAALREALVGPAPRLELVGPIAFPRPARATVAGVELRDRTDALATLHRGVEEAVRRAAGIPPEDRPLRAHVTLVRFRRPTRIAPDASDDRERAFDCSRCALYDSHQVTGGPPRYQALLVATLEAPSGARDEPSSEDPDP
ncbi:MAG: 2,3-cyclic 3-phosphodiesterase [Miltoncostaeaceae bacterium]|nr:2,3-cyclic 3-phosphodiesterase [Miltoncostaeaceae bacterium]